MQCHAMPSFSYDQTPILLVSRMMNPLLLVGWLKKYKHINSPAGLRMACAQFESGSKKKYACPTEIKLM